MHSLCKIVFKNAGPGSLLDGFVGIQTEAAPLCHYKIRNYVELWNLEIIKMRSGIKILVLNYFLFVHITHYLITEYDLSCPSRIVVVLCLWISLC